MKLAIIGLGKMGGQIAERLLAEGHEVIANDQTPELVEQAVAKGAVAAADKQSVLTAFNGEPAVIWLMIPAAAVDQETDLWLEVLPPGSIIIDGGNSDYRLTLQRHERAQAKQVRFVDVGTSGGILGLANGFSLMVGGDVASFTALEPIFKALSQPNGAYHFFGSPGAGHYVKMVHNAIEYGMMQSLAEGYRLLKEGPFSSLDLAAAGEVWQHGSIIASSLNGLTAEAVSENPQLEGIEGVVAESGEARWALETAETQGIPMPAVTASLDVRKASQNGDTNFSTKLLAAMRNKFGGHAVNAAAGGPAESPASSSSDISGER